MSQENKVEVTGIKKFLIFNRDYLAGCAAGIACALIGQPFDTLKVKLQSSKTKVSLGHVFTTIVKEEGPQALYRGVMSPLLSLSAIESIRFGTQQWAYRQLNQARGSTDNTQMVINYSIAGSIGSIVAMTLTSPMEHVRIKMQLLEKGNTLYTNTFQCAKYIVANYGIKGLYSGVLPCLIREGYGYLFYFGTYDYCVRKFKTLVDNPKDPKTLMAIQLTAGPIAGVVLWTSSYPFDTINSIIKGDSLQNPKYHGIMSVYKDVGFKALWKGWVPCVLRALPANVGVFFSFEQTKNIINSMDPNYKHEF